MRTATRICCLSARTSRCASGPIWIWGCVTTRRRWWWWLPMVTSLCWSITTPSHSRKGETLDIAATAEQALRDLARRFDLCGVAFDPWQAIDLGQCLSRAHLNMVEVAQTAMNQAPMANQLIDLMRQRRLAMYPSRELRLAVSKTVIVESTRGYRLGKVKGSIASIQSWP
jgi:hypothetical protein